jgi:hypothetical protein
MRYKRLGNWKYGVMEEWNVGKKNRLRVASYAFKEYSVILLFFRRLLLAAHALQLLTLCAMLSALCEFLLHKEEYLT